MSRGGVISMMMSRREQKKLERLNMILRMLHSAIEDGILPQDPEDENYMFLYRAASENSPEGWYREPILSVGIELNNDRGSFYSFCYEISKERKRLASQQEDGAIVETGQN